MHVNADASAQTPSNPTRPAKVAKSEEFAIFNVLRAPSFIRILHTSFQLAGRAIPLTHVNVQPVDAACLRVLIAGATGRDMYRAGARAANEAWAKIYTVDRDLVARPIRMLGSSNRAEATNATRALARIDTHTISAQVGRTSIDKTFTVTMTGFRQDVRSNTWIIGSGGNVQPITGAVHALCVKRCSSQGRTR